MLTSALSIIESKQLSILTDIVDGDRLCLAVLSVENAVSQNLEEVSTSLE